MNKYRVLSAENEWLYIELGIYKGYPMALLTNKEGQLIVNSSLELRSDTLSLFTTFQDKNRQDIYIGDILKKEIWDILLGKARTLIFVIEFKKGSIVGWNKATGNREICAIVGKTSRTELPIIIGNQWQNPELLKDEMKENE